MPTNDAANGTVPHMENSKEKEVARASPKEVAPGTPQAGVQRALRALLGVACGKIEAYPANASEWDEYYGDEGQYDRDGAAEWEKN